MLRPYRLTGSFLLMNTAFDSFGKEAAFMKEAVLNLTALEVFFIVTTLISLVFNVIQWRDSKASKEPLSNTLVAMFNDIKSKSTNIYQTYNILFSPNNPHKDIATLRWEYGLFAQSILSHLQGLQEQVVGLIVSLRPDDKEGQLAFRASEYGMTNQERDLRQQNLERLLRAGVPEDKPTTEKSVN